MQQLKNNVCFSVFSYSLKPATLTLWNQYVHNEGEAIAAIIKTRPIIIGYRLKITAYGGNNHSHSFINIGLHAFSFNGSSFSPFFPFVQNQRCQLGTKAASL